MKKAIFILITLLSLNSYAQEYTFQITANELGRFTLDVITELSDTRLTIDRTADLDSTQLQTQQYARIEQAYNQIANAEQARLKALRQANALRRSLASVGLESFNAFQIAKYDSTFVTDNARLNRTGQEVEICYVQYRQGNTSVLRRQSDNSVIGVIVPFSPNYIRLNISEAERIGGNAFVFMSANNSRDFRGGDEEGNTYFLRIIR